MKGNLVCIVCGASKPLSYMPTTPLELDCLAREAGMAIVTDYTTTDVVCSCACLERHSFDLKPLGTMSRITL